MQKRSSAEKTCLRCKKLLPLVMFHKNKGKPDGHVEYCKDCISVMRTQKSVVTDLDGEIWCDIQGFEGVYMISNYGRIKHRQNSHRETLRIPHPAPNGYLRLVLSYQGKRVTASVHREVAKAFLPNPNGFDSVNHIDFNKTNNSVSNLEWLPIKENILHAKENGKNNRKSVGQYLKDGTLVRVWASAYEVEKTLGFFSTLISRCCRGIQKSHKGFVWKFQ